MKNHIKFIFFVYALLSPWLLVNGLKPIGTVEINEIEYPEFSFKDIGPQKVKAVAPVYPIGDKRKGKGGTTLVYMLVDGKGKVSHAKIKSTDASEAMQKAILKVATKWKFPVFKKNGEPIQYVVTIPFKMSVGRRL